MSSFKLLLNLSDFSTFSNYFCCPNHFASFSRISFPLCESMGKRETTGAPPKGWMGIRVGIEGEEQQRFLVPVMYLKHPLFLGLLKEAEEEYGFKQEGIITIPCRVDHFRHVQNIIDRNYGTHQNHHHHGGNYGHHGHFHLVGCFRA
ncbi:hypothetical protein LUZ60_011840 [Juncus effusus]|nr:hypothetical protein LUZ60_011840 [Juncus effusus]